jgi:CBS domain-containing protein
MVVIPNYQSGWIDERIVLKGKDKAKIKDGKGNDHNDDFDPINRLSVLKAASKNPISISRDATLEKAYHIMWKNEFSQLPIMNNEREVLGIISWQTIAKGLISKKNSNTVKDFMTDDFIVLDGNTPLFESIKQVIKKGIVFVSNEENKIKGPVTTSDLNEQFIEQIEPYILLEQIENYIRLLLHDKIILEEIIKLLTIEDDERKLDSISDMTFGEYQKVFENKEMWDSLGLPFDRADFVNDLDEIRKIRNGVMHFHPDSISSSELKFLRKTSEFLMDYGKNC